LQQKYSLTTHNPNNNARCKKSFLAVEMTIPMRVNRQLLRIKLKIKQEITRTLESTRVGDGGSTTPPKLLIWWKSG